MSAMLTDMLQTCVDHNAVLCLTVASDWQIDERSILFVGSKDAVSISFSFVLFLLFLL